jgi:hypothetical protein
MLLPQFWQRSQLPLRTVIALSSIADVIKLFSFVAPLRRNFEDYVLAGGALANRRGNTFTQRFDHRPSVRRQFEDRNVRFARRCWYRRFLSARTRTSKLASAKSSNSPLSMPAHPPFLNGFYLVIRKKPTKRRRHILVEQDSQRSLRPTRARKSSASSRGTEGKYVTNSSNENPSAK